MYEPRQLFDNITVKFDPPGKCSEKLRVLRVEKQLSMRDLEDATGHTRPYLRQQLRKFGIVDAKKSTNLAPYGWDWKGRILIRNEQEQLVLGEIKKLRKKGSGSKSIAAELNSRGVKSKTGGRWHCSSVRNILKRMFNKV